MKTKQMFYFAYNAGNIKSKTVKAYSLKKGAFCTVSEINGKPTISVSSSRFVNDALSTMLIKAGITGEVLIGVNNIHRNLGGWLAYKLHNVPIEKWIKNITVYTFDSKEVFVDGLNVVNIPHEVIQIKDIESKIVEYSKDYTFDGLKVEAEDISGLQTYRFVPNRTTYGIIKDITYDNDATCIKVYIKYGRKEINAEINNLTNKMRNQLKELGSRAINHKVKVRYSSYVPYGRDDSFNSISALYLIENDNSAVIESNVM